MEQAAFDFRPTSVDLEYASCVMRWVQHHGRGMVEAFWPDYKLTSWFRDWKVALDYVLHPLNMNHVRLKVRP